MGEGRNSTLFFISNIDNREEMLYNIYVKDEGEKLWETSLLIVN